MADTGIIYRRDSKARLSAEPPLDGEVVYATDTQEYGALVGNVIVWRPHKNNITKELADTWYNPLDVDYVHTDNNYTDVEKNKLAGIEIGATADQTKDEIDALGINAETLDSLNSTQFVRNDVDSTISANLIVTGNVTVQGTTTTIDSETINLADNVIVLNSGTSGAPSENAGIEIDRGDYPNVILQWNESKNSWEYTKDGVNFYDIIDKNDELTLSVLDATKWTTPRNIQLSGSVVGNISIDGTTDVNMGVSVVNDSHSHTISTLTVTSVDIVYDNSTSGLTATNVKNAIDELNTNIENIPGAFADGVSYDDTNSSLTATNVQTAIDALDSNINSLSSDAIDITYTNFPSGLSATDVQTAIDELNTNANNHFGSTGSDHTYINQDVTTTSNPTFGNVQVQDITNVNSALTGESY